MVHIVRKGYELIIVHGNGPQVGNLLIQMEEAVTKIPPYTLDVCDAMTEGSMGFMLERAITNELRRHSIDKDVDHPRHPGPRRPERPGLREARPSPSARSTPRYRAQQLTREKKWTMVEDAGRGLPQGRPLAQADRRRPQMDHPRPRPGRPDRHRRRRRRHPGHPQQPRPVRRRRSGHRQGLRREPDRPRSRGGPVHHPDRHRPGLSRLRKARPEGTARADGRRRPKRLSTRASSRRARWGRRSGPPSNTSRPAAGKS